MKRLLISIVFLALGGISRSAAADATVFIGTNVTPTTRVVKGLAIGISVLVVGFEFEYASNGDDENASKLSPALRTGMINLLIQTPNVTSVQLYLTAGGGLYRERLDNGVHHQETHFGTNIGGGAKFRLAGPLRLRADYRLFKLSGEPLESTPQRFYLGLNLAF